MSKFEQKIIDAKRYQGRSRLTSFIVILLIVVIAIGAYAASSRIGYIEVNVLPSEAAGVADIEVLDGYGFVFDDALWGIKRGAVLGVTAPGFAAEELQISEAAWERNKVDVILRQLLATISVTSDPKLEDVHWYLDDVLISRGSILNSQMEAGQYRLSAKHIFYDTANYELITEPGGTYEFTLPLAPVEGEITITSEPANAQIAFNSEVVGTTPLKVLTAGGKKDLSISLEGYESQEDSFSITNENRQASRHYALKLLTYPVTVSFSPKGGTVAFNGKLTSEHALRKLQLPANTHHKILYSKPGYSTKEVEFKVRAGSANEVEIQLQPQYGIVEVYSEPEADIEVNGKPVGQTPKRLELQTVNQNIVLTRPGYLSVTRKVTPKHDSLTAVAVVLESKKDHRLRTAPDQYTNSVEMELKLNKELGSFTMGSERGEIGRRANEFPREIRLTRPFYAGVHEVTVGQYRQFEQSSQSPINANFPVTGVDWISAAKFCNWLSLKEGLEPVYRFIGDTLQGSDAAADGYRMLTEAEWEWLARKAGRFERTEFPWGDSKSIPKDSGNLADESAKSLVKSYIPNYEDGSPQLSEVGRYRPNRAGIHDLAGNVSEWTHDTLSLQPPPKDVVESDPWDAGSGRHRTIKGSNWHSATLSELRAAWRDVGSSTGDDDLGFRVGRYLYGGN